MHVCMCIFHESLQPTRARETTYIRSPSSRKQSQAASRPRKPEEGQSQVSWRARHLSVLLLSLCFKTYTGQ